MAVLQYAVALKLGSWFGKTRGYYDEESIELKWSYSTINLRLLPYIKIYNIKLQGLRHSVETEYSRERGDRVTPTCIVFHTVNLYHSVNWTTYIEEVSACYNKVTGCNFKVSAYNV